MEGADGEEGCGGVEGCGGAEGADGVEGCDGVEGTGGEEGCGGVEGAGGVEGCGGAEEAGGAEGCGGVEGCGGMEGCDGVEGWQGGVVQRVSLQRPPDSPSHQYAAVVFLPHSISPEAGLWWWQRRHVSPLSPDRPPSAHTAVTDSAQGSPGGRQGASH